MVTSLVGCFGGRSSSSYLEYRRSGGIIGLDDSLSIDSKGHAVLIRGVVRHELVVDQLTMDQLHARLDAAHFFGLGFGVSSVRRGADLIEYRTTFKGHSVRTMDTAVPPGLLPVLELLNGLLDSRGK